MRIGSLPVEDKLRELRHIHLNALIKFRGVVTKRTGVFPQYLRFTYTSYRCNYTIHYQLYCGDCVNLHHIKNIKAVRLVSNNEFKQCIVQSWVQSPSRGALQCSHFHNFKWNLLLFIFYSLKILKKLSWNCRSIKCWYFFQNSSNQFGIESEFW